MSSHVKRRVAPTALLIALLMATGAGADPFVDALFDPSRLHAVEISMAAEAWAQLRARYLENTNYEATLTFDGETISKCTIRSRGSGTRNGVKPGLRVDFYRKDPAQRFHGFRTLVLDNMYNDSSFLREQLAFDVFREMNVLVPREAYARLTVNGEYWGLYAIVEPIDEVFVATHIDGGGGNLFEYNVPPSQPGQLLAWDFTLSRGATIDGYVPEPFELETDEDRFDGTALLDFLRVITESERPAFVEEVSEFIDPRHLLTYYAVEVATAEVDGLTSFFGVNNFYLYQREGGRFFQFLPWDHDFNFLSATHRIDFGMERNRLIQRLLFDSSMKAFYRATLRDVVTRFVNLEWMGPRIDAKVALIRAAVLADTKRRGGDNPATAVSVFENAIATIEAVVAGRAASVEEQLNARRRRAVRATRRSARLGKHGAAVSVQSAMSRLLLPLLLVTLLSGACSHQQLEVSSGLLPLHVTIDTPLKPCGKQRFVLRDTADAEQHLFVDAEERGEVRRFVWIQYEQFLPGVAGRYNYSSDEPVEVSGLPFAAAVGRYTGPPAAGSDRERAYALIASCGHTMPALATRARLVHVPEGDGRRELMIIYGESATRSDDPSAEETRAMIERARNVIRVTRR